MIQFIMALVQFFVSVTLIQAHLNVFEQAFLLTAAPLGLN